MADEKRGSGVKLGEFQLGSPCEDVGPELGHLYEARHGETEQAALVLLPCSRVDWMLEDSWRVRLSSQREPPAVTLAVEQAPASGGAVKLANLLVLMSTAVTRVEDNTQVEAHLAGGERRPRRRGRWGRVGLLGGVALVLVLGGWRAGREGDGSSRSVLAPLAEVGRTYLGFTEEPEARPVSYPVPSKPLEHQATAPCKTHRDEVEINGGCWMELARKPPCLEETQSEYQGKCYMPVVKQNPPRRSVQP